MSVDENPYNEAHQIRVLEAQCRDLRIALSNKTDQLSRVIGVLVFAAFIIFVLFFGGGFHFGPVGL